MRKKLLVGNWKMNKTRQEALVFAEASIALSDFAEVKKVDIGVTPTFLSLDIVKKTNPRLIVGAQNVHFKASGAFTGEISIPMLQELGIEWSLVGHSERRTYNGETNKTCNEKVIALLNNKMVPLYCVGETLEEFEKGDTKKIVGAQVREGLASINKDDARKVVVAYEPVWSIGTGKNASKEIAEDICGFIRGVLKEMFGGVADEMRILYGGSVKPENIKEYMAEPNIDGALVGGASLTVESFKQLIENID